MRYECTLYVVENNYYPIIQNHLDTGLVWVQNDLSTAPSQDTYTYYGGNHYHLLVRDLQENRTYRAVSNIRVLLPEDFGITDYETNETIEKWKEMRKGTQI